MRLKRVSIATGAITVGLAGGALASHVQEVDPQTVPTGYLAAHNRVQVIQADAVRQAVEHGAEVAIRHIHFEPGQPSPWHGHPGPHIVSVVRGSLTYERVVAGACRRDTYQAGSGFTDRGFGNVHRVVAGPQGADVYVVYILPRGTGENDLPAEAPRACMT